MHVHLRLLGLDILYLELSTDAPADEDAIEAYGGVDSAPLPVGFFSSVPEHWIDTIPED